MVTPMPILDQHGHPLDQSSPPDLPQSRRIATLAWDHATSPLSLTTPAALGRVLRLAEQGDLTAQSDLFEVMEERDAHLHAEYAKRKRALLKCQWAIQPPSNPSPDEKKLAESLSDLLTDIEGLDDAVFDLSDAIGHGYSPVEITWQRSSNVWLPAKLTRQPGRWMMIDPLHPRELRLKNGGMGEPLQPFGWIVHQVRARSGYPGTSALLRVLAWPWLFKHFSFGDFSEFLEGYGLPLRLGKYPGHASESEQDKLLMAVRQLGRHGAGIIPDDMEIGLTSVPIASADAFLAMIEYCDKAMSKALLGGTLSSQADGKSSTNALGTVHDDARHELTEGDAKQLADTLTRQLLYPLAALNFGASSMSRLPRWVFDTRKPADMALYAKSLPALVAIGVKIPVDWAQEKLGIPTPTDGQAVLTVANPSMAIPPALRPPTPPPADAALTAALSADYPLQTDQATQRDSAWTAQLAQRGDPIVSGWIAQIAALVADPSIAHPADLAARLIDLYGGLPAGDLTKVMQFADATAQLTGRFEVIGETGAGGEA